MKKLYLLAALLMASTAAHAGNAVSLQIGGHKIRHIMLILLHKFSIYEINPRINPLTRGVAILAEAISPLKAETGVRFP